MNRSYAFILFVGLVFSLIFACPKVILAYVSPSLTTVNTINYAQNHGLLPLIGDVNGDGYPDLVSGTYIQNSLTNGVAFVNFGNNSSFTSTPDLTVTGSANGNWLSGVEYGEGISVGDVNDDGYDDILLGAMGNADAGANTGKVYLFFGSPSLSGAKTALDANQTGNRSGSNYYGLQVAILDTNNDSKNDIVISEYGTASIHSYLNTNNSIDLNNINYTLVTTGTMFFQGSALKNGDFDADGNNDLIICSRYGTNDKCHLLKGLGTGEFVQTSVFNSVLSSDYLGRNGSVTVGDINNDEKDDFCIGQHRNSVLGTDQGRAYCFYGRASFKSSYSVTEADITLNGEEAKDSFGRSLFLYDVTNDGYLDLLVGAHEQYDTAGIRHGKFYIYKNSSGTFTDSPWLSEIKTTGNAVYGLGVAATDTDLDGWTDIVVSQPYTNDVQVSTLNHYEISHGTPSISLNSILPLYGSGSTTVVTGTATDSNSDYSISGVEWSETNSPFGTWTDCTATDGSFDSTSESFSCEFGSMNEGSSKRLYVRTHDQNGLYLPSNLYEVTNTFDMNTRQETGSSTPDVYQISQQVQKISTANQIVTPIKDSYIGSDQKVVAIIPPQTFNFNAYLSSNINKTILGTSNTLNTTSGIFTKVSDIQEIWYKAYPPEGSNTSTKIIPDLQTKPSILSLSFTGNYTNLKIAHSLDGKTWKILPNSIIDTKNKTVAVITKIGGYYTLVKPNYTQTSVLGTSASQPTLKPSPIPTQIINKSNNQINAINENNEEKWQGLFSNLINNFNAFVQKFIK